MRVRLRHIDLRAPEGFDFGESSLEVTVEAHEKVPGGKVTDAPEAGDERRRTSVEKGPGKSNETFGDAVLPQRRLAGTQNHETSLQRGEEDLPGQENSKRDDSEL